MLMLERLEKTFEIIRYANRSICFHVVEAYHISQIQLYLKLSLLWWIKVILVSLILLFYMVPFYFEKQSLKNKIKTISHMFIHLKVTDDLNDHLGWIWKTVSENQLITFVTCVKVRTVRPLPTKGLAKASNVPSRLPSLRLSWIAQLFHWPK